MLRGLLRPLEQCESFSALQCAFVVGKNYRLQDIQLSKSRTQGPERGSQGSPRRRKTGGLAQLNSGEYRARTGDLLVANQALSQLS